MNDLFIADSVNLSSEQIAFFKALIKKASVNDGDCQLTPQTSQQLSETSSQTHPQPVHQLHPDPRTSDATQGVRAAYAPIVQTELPLLRSGGGGGGGVFMDMLSGPSWAGAPSGTQRVPTSAAMPTFLQKQLASTQKGSPEQAQWLSNLEDSVMNIPSQELLMAATQDIREKRSRPLRLESAPSLIAPRTLSELERSLCASSSFMREAIAAGMTGMLSESQLMAGGGTATGPPSRFGAAGDAPGSPPQSGDQHLLVDAGPFLFEGGADLPHANLSNMVTSFDWDSFNSAFAPGGELGKDATGAMAVCPAATAGGSAWGRVCKEVGLQLSKGNLGERPPSWVPGMR